MLGDVQWDGSKIPEGAVDFSRDIAGTKLRTGTAARKDSQEEPKEESYCIGMVSSFSFHLV